MKTVIYEYKNSEYPRTLIIRDDSDRNKILLVIGKTDDGNDVKDNDLVDITLLFVYNNELISLTDCNADSGLAYTIINDTNLRIVNFPAVYNPVIELTDSEDNPLDFFTNVRIIKEVYVDRISSPNKRTVYTYENKSPFYVEPENTTLSAAVIAKKYASLFELDENTLVVDINSGVDIGLAEVNP